MQKVQQRHATDCKHQKLLTEILLNRTRYSDYILYKVKSMLSKDQDLNGVRTNHYVHTLAKERPRRFRKRQTIA